MSAELVSRPGPPGVPHSFRDDLESSIYVLLWVTVMYSVVSDKCRVPPFLAHVLDAGGLTKKDFLISPTFLRYVQFPNRPALHTLIDNLAKLFKYRYEEEPTDSQRVRCEDLRLMAAQNSGSDFWQGYYEMDACRLYDLHKPKLNDHTATIELFNAALRDRSEWPVDDLAVKQVFEPYMPFDDDSEPTRKSDWSTGFD